ncbi:uncharacterized protein LOC9645105 [Selaginella moellendorffii]|uniref:uncharacterized protein LOC9645105 n=1 Tax=Selaginella moellendorffii TaxID=88036 RepID=UPI000D1CEEFB|nr:uncharacterized protein LOC9645105 [Selaginella moellendorffii]|eukprot:XP_002984770.2 uncharacterized protein LOC9645105 [Selaginella moellendorffii]
MEELRELCRSGKDVKLGDAEVWEEDPSELAIAKQILEEHFYVQDPSDPSLFVLPKIKTKRLVIDSSSAGSSPSSLLFPTSIPQIDYTAPPLSSSDDRNAGHPLYRIAGDGDGSSWRPCHCIQLDSRNPSSPQVRIAIPAAIQHKVREQRVAISLAIEPSVRITPANVDVELRIKTLSVGVLLMDVLKNEAALGFYPCRIRFLVEPLLGDPSAVAIPLYTPRSDRGGGSSSGSTRTRSSANKVGAQVGFGPVTISGERSWGVEFEESTEREMISAGDWGGVEDELGSGNTAVFEWRLLRWSHNGVRYNANKPHSGLSLSTKSLKAPFPGGSTGIKVESFPDVMWHLHPSMRSRFPLQFKLQLEVEMHLLWFVGRNRLFRVAEWSSEAFEFRHDFVVTDGVFSTVT